LGMGIGAKQEKATEGEERNGRGRGMKMGEFASLALGLGG